MCMPYWLWQVPKNVGCLQSTEFCNSLSVHMFPSNFKDREREKTFRWIWKSISSTHLNFNFQTSNEIGKPKKEPKTCLLTRLSQYIHSFQCCPNSCGFVVLVGVVVCVKADVPDLGVDPITCQCDISIYSWVIFVATDSPCHNSTLWIAVLWWISYWAD